MRFLVADGTTTDSLGEAKSRGVPFVARHTGRVFGDLTDVHRTSLLCALEAHPDFGDDNVREFLLAFLAPRTSFGCEPWEV